MTVRISNLRPRGIAGQLALIVVLAVIVALALTSALFVALRPPTHPESPGSVAARIGTIVQLVANASPGERARLLDILHDKDVVMRTGAAAEPQAPSTMDREAAPFPYDLERELSGISPLPRFAVHVGDDRRSLVTSVWLQDGTALTFQSPWAKSSGPLHWGPLILATASMAITIAWLSLWATRRVTAPLSAFAEAAERLGNERSTTSLNERGPVEIVRAARAFNQMQYRLRRFMADQTRMLAAIGHDLRTPITRLRLRAEAAVEDADALAGMLGDLRRMEDMISSILVFLRENRHDEPVDIVDIPSLLETICDEAADLGHQISYRGPKTFPLSCHPQLLERAISNVVENAIKFGELVEIRLLDEDPDEIAIVVEDDGPGVPESEIERLFEPFYRADADRNVDTGGVGLGLSITRAFIHAHGGRVELSNRLPTGLRVRLALPRRPLSGEKRRSFLGSQLDPVRPT